jgi:hypothetical protein
VNVGLNRWVRISLLKQELFACPAAKRCRESCDTVRILECPGAQALKRRTFAFCSRDR